MRTELSGAVQFANKNFAHRTIFSGHRLKIVDNGINGSETTVCSLYCGIVIGLLEIGQHLKYAEEMKQCKLEIEVGKDHLQ